MASVYDDDPDMDDGSCPHGERESYDCDKCALAERQYMNRREWNEFHPGEPCPDIELNK